MGAMLLYSFLILVRIYMFVSDGNCVYVAIDVCLCIKYTDLFTRSQSCLLFFVSLSRFTTIVIIMSHAEQEFFFFSLLIASISTLNTNARTFHSIATLQMVQFERMYVLCIRIESENTSRSKTNEKKVYSEKRKERKKDEQKQHQQQKMWV